MIGIALVLAIIGAMAPVFVLLRFLHERAPGPRRTLDQVQWLYAISFLTAFPAVFLEILAGGAGFMIVRVFAPPMLARLVVSALSVGLIEESIKYAFLRRLAYRRRDFTTVYDGVLFGGVVSLGFATVENIAYVLAAFGAGGVEHVILARALTAVPVHTALGMIMGYYTGRAKVARTERVRRRQLAAALWFPVLAHAGYDLLAFAAQADYGGRFARYPLAFGLVATIVTLCLIATRLLNRARNDRTIAGDAPSAPRDSSAAWRAAERVSYQVRATGVCARCGDRAPRLDVLCGPCSGVWAARV